MSTVVPRPDAAPSWCAGPYADALRTGRGPLFLRRPDGWLLPLDVERWCAAPDPADLSALRRCAGPVLDIGCGPGRLVAALAALGRRTLGIDVSEAAVRHTLELGGTALRRSVFETLPGEGRWGTALLMDGNIGIGGDPAALLARVAELLAPRGLLIAETAPVDIDERVRVHLDDGRGRADPDEVFPWARIGTPALLGYARAAGWQVADQWSADGRSFVALRRRDPREGAAGRAARGVPDPHRAHPAQHPAARQPRPVPASRPDRDTDHVRTAHHSADPANSAAVTSSHRVRNTPAGRVVDRS
ncbi:class I SAM-dependent methyltransferase [Streptomyces flavofungini]|uniref:Methyltransferase domain-containing protein n=1 Tax=Streptomyces flavofungini TaxID=68200 RepID=A0ABS0XF68_9ACTN|nr:methyltransferase domain-containing protein [Streptomyces flavofungini]MBJ3811611.1 methyltransferase domain-containing protein [Streptomyces flavofungini]GHC86265.1 methyltransferase type 11 [Streptomyces flavofungini]